MLRHHVNVNAETVDGETALHLAANTNRPETVDVLLEHGADVNAQDDNGSTPLCGAIVNGADYSIRSQLLAHGANPNLANDVGDNALSLAQWLHPDFADLLIQHGAVPKRADPPTVVPLIADLVGVQVGYNGQEALKRQFGEGLHTTGGHPGGFKNWYTRNPTGQIETDGFEHSREGLVLEWLSWSLEPATDPRIPFVRQLPRRAGWLGVVYPGMTMKQVATLTAGKLPSPEKKGDTWTWTDEGFVRPGPTNIIVYTNWTAELTFQNGLLLRIDLRCDGKTAAPLEHDKGG
jgi:hypothetical protein